MAGAADIFEELRREYLTEAPARLGELRKDVAAWIAGEADAGASLKTRFHRLAGSGGSYGFPEITTIARAAEAVMAAATGAAAEPVGQVEAAIADLAASFNREAAALGLPAVAPTPKPTAFGWQALIVGPAGGLIDRADATLQDAQYTVRRRPLGFERNEIPVAERPDLAVVIGTDPAETAEVVARWTEPGATRPHAVVLVAPPEGADSLAAPYSGLDAMIPGDRIEYGLLGFSRGLGRGMTSPRSVLIVDEQDAGTARSLATALEGAACRVAVATSIDETKALLLRETWDLVLMEWRLRGTTPAALIRWIHQVPRRRLEPVIVFTDSMTDGERLAAIRAGAEDVLLKTAAPKYLADCVLARIDRSRTIRAVAHRDDLTGLLNPEAIHEELERAIAAGRRANESVSLLMFDIDHFRRVNEALGQVAGDHVLVQIGRTIAGTVRSSDLVARMGGEEFGVLVRRCRTADAVRLAEKVRAAVAALAISAGDGGGTVHLSSGVACFPDHGADWQEVLRAADKALLAAKASRRDRVVSAGAL